MSSPDDGDLEAWMDALAGRGGARPDPLAQRLGQALRAEAASRRLGQVQPPTAEQLLAAAGPMAGRPPCRLCAWLASQRGTWLGTGRRTWAAAAMAAVGVALLSVLVVAFQAGHDVRESDPEVLRGGAGVTLLHDPSPLARRERLAAALEAAGVEVRRYERLGRAGLAARLDAAQAARLGAWLRTEGIAPAADGSLEVEVEAPR